MIANWGIFNYTKLYLLEICWSGFQHRLDYLSVKLMWFNTQENSPSSYWYEDAFHCRGLGLYAGVCEYFHKLEANGLDTEGKKQVLAQHKDEIEVNHSLPNLIPQYNSRH